MKKLLRVILILCVACMLIANNEIYFGFVLMAFSYFTIIILAASSVRGDFNKTALEIEMLRKHHQKPTFHYLSYSEQLIMIEERKKQGIKERKRKSAKNKAKARRISRRTDNNTSFDAWDDDLISTNSTSSLSDNDDVIFIDETTTDIDSFEETYINPSSGMIMIGGIGGIDAGGNVWGQSNSFDDLSSDSHSSIDDSFNSFDDSIDFTNSGMDE